MQRRAIPEPIEVKVANPVVGDFVFTDLSSTRTHLSGAHNMALVDYMPDVVLSANLDHRSRRPP